MPASSMYCLNASLASSSSKSYLTHTDPSYNLYETYTVPTDSGFPATAFVIVVNAGDALKASTDAWGLPGAFLILNLNSS